MIDVQNDTDFEAQTRALREAIGPQIAQARDNLSQLNTRVASFIRHNPGTTLLGALAVGFVVGKLASRR